MDGHVTGTSHSNSQPQLWMMSGRLVSTKSARITRCLEWMPHWEKFSEKALQASSSRNRICEGVGSEEDDVLECKGFWDGADSRLGAIDKTNVNRRRGERKKDNQKSSKAVQIYQVYWKESTYAWGMHEHVICKRNCIMGSIQSNPTST